MLDGKNIIITGASRGLGKHIAEAMWREGANLLLVARSESALIALQRELETTRTEQHVRMVATDLGQPDAIQQIFAKASEFVDGIDVLVNNAAIQGPIGPLPNNDPTEWAQTIAVNLTAPVMLCRAVIPLMGKRSRAKIINLSGGGATGPRANFSAYASAKAGLVRFSETLAQEIPHIDVNCVAPGPMGSQMLDEVMQAGAERAGEREYETAKNLLRDGTTQTFDRPAHLCIFLASSQSDGITGKLISAIWDPWMTWKHFPQNIEILRSSDVYTLRRITADDRDVKWSVD